MMIQSFVRKVYRRRKFIHNKDRNIDCDKTTQDLKIREFPAARLITINIRRLVKKTQSREYQLQLAARLSSIENDGNTGAMEIRRISRRFALHRNIECSKQNSSYFQLCDEVGSDEYFARYNFCRKNHGEQEGYAPEEVCRTTKSVCAAMEMR